MAHTIGNSFIDHIKLPGRRLMLKYASHFLPRHIFNAFMRLHQATLGLDSTSIHGLLWVDTSNWVLDSSLIRSSAIVLVIYSIKAFKSLWSELPTIKALPKLWHLQDRAVALTDCSCNDVGSWAGFLFRSRNKARCHKVWNQKIVSSISPSASPWQK